VLIGSLVANFDDRLHKCNWSAPFGNSLYGYQFGPKASDFGSSNSNVGPQLRQWPTKNGNEVKDFRVKT